MWTLVSFWIPYLLFLDFSINVSGFIYLPIYVSWCWLARGSVSLFKLWSLVLNVLKTFMMLLSTRLILKFDNAINMYVLAEAVWVVQMILCYFSFILLSMEILEFEIFSLDFKWKCVIRIRKCHNYQTGCFGWWFNLIFDYCAWNLQIKIFGCIRVRRES